MVRHLLLVLEVERVDLLLLSLYHVERVQLTVELAVFDASDELVECKRMLFAQVGQVAWLRELKLQ